jgi:hypothetical protein
LAINDIVGTDAEKEPEHLVDSAQSASDRTCWYFSPVVALSCGVILSVFARLGSAQGDAEVIVASGYILSFSAPVALLHHRRRVILREPVVAAVWSIAIPSLIAFIVAGALVTADAL